jgi:hypothetical protein
MGFDMVRLAMSLADTVHVIEPASAREEMRNFLINICKTDDNVDLFSKVLNPGEESLSKIMEYEPRKKCHNSTPRKVLMSMINRFKVKKAPDGIKPFPLR